MMRTLVRVVFTALVLFASCSAAEYARRGLDLYSPDPPPEASQVAQDMLRSIAPWLAANFDLPDIAEVPGVRFMAKDDLAKMRAKDSLQWQGEGQYESIDRRGQRSVLALYQRLRQQLDCLSERELLDLGISRGEIEYLVSNGVNAPDVRVRPFAKVTARPTEDHRIGRVKERCIQ